MPLKITPASALLTAGQAITFQATDDAGASVIAAWTHTPQLGGLVKAAAPLEPQTSFSATYVAPSILQAAQTVVVTATTATDTASVTISLTPDAISIVPAVVELQAKQTQHFEAIVASALGEAEEITWVLAPQIGTLDTNGSYTAPDTIPSDTTLTVTAACKKLGKQTSAKVTLTPEPWRGIGPALLAAYLFIVFLSVYLLIAIWPTEVSNIDLLAAAQAQAKITVENTELALQNARQSAPSAQPQASAELIVQLTKDAERAQAALDDARTKLISATSPNVKTASGITINREIDLLCLVMLAGTIGSFIHMAQSFSDFAGNRTLKSSWVWWYCFLPFVGAGLALVLYTGLRGGLITVATTPAIKDTDLNPFGLVAAGIFAGLFSKQATKKLAEIFENVFQLSRGSQTKDPLRPEAANTSQPAKPGAGANK